MSSQAEISTHQLTGKTIKKDSLLRIYPVTTVMGETWIGIHDGSIAWLSFGELDREEVRHYWKGLIEEGGECPISAEELERAASGKGSLKIVAIGTPFQMKVWKALLSIPFSDTRTYGEIAVELGSKGHARAVGSAVGSNPVSWLIPCHRVLPASGEPGNYRWGSETKVRLLNWENGTPGTNKATRRKLESMLINAKRFEDISKMAGDIAHDLNNLLAPIRMATELLKTKLEDKSLDRYVEIIETSTGRARSVIQEILSFSRETEAVQRRTLKVNPILVELEKIVRSTFPERIHLDFSYREDIPDVEMDPTQLHRAVLNILVNARDAIKKEGEISVRVSVHDLEMRVRVGEMSFSPGRFVCISISDTGSGIPDEIRERIFDPFFTTKPKEEGTGLGLASVYGIIARTGGFIDLESMESKGTTFHLFIPEASSTG